MDGPLLFRLVLIVVAGFALVMIISNYNSALAPSLEQNRAVGEQFQQFADNGMAGGMVSGMAGGAQAQAYGDPDRREKHVTPIENGTLTATAGGAQASAALAPPGTIDTLKPSDLLPRVGNTPEEQKFLSVNPSVTGDVGSQNFLHAGYWQGSITNVQKVANKQLRSDPLIIPQKVSPWMNTPFEMNAPNRPFEIGSVSSV